MLDDRIDFSPLDPTREPERFERIVGAIGAAAAPQLAAYRARAGVVGQVASWWRPLLAAAAITGIAALATLARVTGAASTSEIQGGIAEAIGVPSGVADWVRSDELPTLDEVLVALEGEG